MNSGKGGLGSTKFVAFETLAWHNECFFCHICKDSMVGKGFIQVRNKRKDERMDMWRLLIQLLLYPWQFQMPAQCATTPRTVRTSSARSAPGRRWSRRSRSSRTTWSNTCFQSSRRNMIQYLREHLLFCPFTNCKAKIVEVSNEPDNTNG